MFGGWVKLFIVNVWGKVTGFPFVFERNLFSIGPLYSVPSLTI